jgi:hypothetical protein
MSKCLCLYGGECELSPNELEELLQERELKSMEFSVSADPFLGIFSARFRAIAKFYKRLPFWLQTKAIAVGAEHVVMQGCYQSGYQLDDYVAQSVTFVCASKRQVKESFVAF